MKIVAPHRLISREVTAADIGIVREAAKEMSQLLWNEKGIGIYTKAGYALAHPQVDDKDPLRFFVGREGVVYINPEIVRHTSYAQPKEEGCLTYSWQGCKAILVPRWHKMTVRFCVLTPHGMSTTVEEDIKGLQAQVFQHEIDHLNGMYIYDRAKKDAPELPDVN